jgi:hypothetical protein
VERPDVARFDLAAVATRYVETRNVRAFHAGNTLTKDILQKTAGLPVNFINYATPHGGPQDWLNTSLSSYGINNVIPNQTDPSSRERPVAIALQRNQPRFWDVMGVRFMLLPRQQAEPLVQQRAAAPVGEYEIGAGTVRKGAAPGGQGVVLLERNAAAFPSVFFDWAGDVPAEEQAAVLAQTAKPIVTDAPAPSAPGSAAAQPAVFSQMRGMRNVFTSRAEIDVPTSGLLVWNERYSENLVAAIDGKPVPLHQANGVWCAVQVPAGKSTVTCRTRTQTGGWLNLLAAAASLLAALSPALLRKPRP